ncbi:hypothetical protein, partial [Phocaeicola vulgatus]|uniref:hypothetical protein n=1 Tax=Phocaeicola vulgatus TaxID=821 RepID=UPI001C6FF5D2
LLLRYLKKIFYNSVAELRFNKIYAKNPPAIIPKSTHKDIPKLEVPPLSHLPRLPMSANR